MKVSEFVRRSNNKRIVKRRFKNSLVSPTSFFDEKTELGGENIIYSNVNICGSQIGYASYINSNSNLMNCRIGKYCSIGSNVEIIAATHPTNFGSTYPGFYNCSVKIPFGVSKKHFDEFITLEDSFYCHIGNDVWIGNHVLIRGGIKIGDGAIIGMGSVVTKDVPPYSIVAGNPIRIIRYRFDEETVKILLKLKWWDLDPSFIKSRRDTFSNIDNLLSLLDKTKNK